MLNRVADDEIGSHRRRRLEARKVVPIGVIHEDASIAMSWLTGTPLDAMSTTKDIESILKDKEAVEVALCA